MKKVFLMMLTLLTLGFAASPVSAQNTLTVADGTETNEYVPVYGWYADAYLKAQFIYPESMLSNMLNNAITEMTFYLTATPSLTSTYNVKIGYATDAVFSGSFLSDANTTVYTGSLPFANDELTIEFDSPFNYTGGNLIVEFSSASTGNYQHTYFYGITSSGSSVQGYDYSDVSSVSPTQRNFLPKTTFSYGTPSLCAKPTNVTANNITTTGATISWTGDVNAASYNIEYMPASGSDWTNALTATSTTNTVDLSGLNPSSSYKVRVQTACSDNTETNWSSVCSFITACDALMITETTPWFENFEGYQGGGEQPFVCWATPVTAAGGGPFVYCGYTPACHSGSNSAELKGANQMLVMPEFSNDIHDLRLSFWATAVTPSNGTLEIGVLPDMDDLTSFEVLCLSGTPSSRNGVGNYMGPFDFNGIQASSGRIAFRYTSSGTGNSWNLDDFTVELSPSCNSPIKTSVTVTDVDGHNATVSWVDNDNTHSSWTVYYKASTDNDYTSQAVTDTSLTLTGLAPETSYSVYVVTNCDGTPGDDATLTVTFTTDVACPAPTAVTASPVYINDATITWNSTATAFNIEYGETGFTQGSGTTDNAYGNTITLTNLNAATSYTVYVQADCGTDDGTSQWASVQFTTLPSCPKPTQIHTSNITTTTADLEWTEGFQESEWELCYGPQGFNPDTVVGEIVTGTPYFQMLNLTANTHYDVYIRAICSSTDTSEWSNLYEFLTPCDAAQLPLVENFDSYPSWYSPDCWRKFEAGNSGSYVAYGAYIYNEQAYSGDKALKFVAGSSSTGYAMLRLPDLDTYDITGLQVKLMAKKTSGSRPLIVGVTPDFNSLDSLVILGSFADLSNDYAEKIVSLENYPGTTGYVVIGLPAGHSTSATIYVDDVTVEVRPTCMYPTDFTATSTSETTVSLSWTELGTSQSWNIEYGPMGFSLGNGNMEVVTDSTHYIVENLAASTAYDFYVQSNCDAMESQWVGPVTLVTSQYSMAVTGSDTITTCGMMIYDNGGANGDYSTDCNSILVLYPATPGTMMMLTGTSNTENNYDYLKIYDGVGTSGTQLANYTGQQNVSVISTTGPLTIHFTSDYTVVKAGFELMASCVACFPPSNVTASNPTLDGATISWSGNADEYAVYVMLTDTAYYTTTDTFLVLNGLIPSSTYQVYVRSLCGADSSVLSSAFSFSTSCGQITITDDNPWFENFDGYTGSGAQSVGACWATPETQQVSNGLSPFVYCGYSGATYSGDNSLEMKGGPTMVVLPEFSNDINTLRISMWGNTTASSASSAGNMVLGYISNAFDATTFVPVDTIPATAFNRTGTDAPHANFIGPYDLNGVTPQPGLRIALRLTDVTTSATGSSTSWNLDDITVSLIPDCPSPVKTSVTVTDIDGHNATINFTDNDPNHNSWTIYYKSSTDADWSTELASTTSYTLTNLDPETTYEVYVVTNCNGTPSTDATNHKTFTTLVACPAPTNLAASNIGMNTATISWNSNAYSFTIEYTEAGGTPVTVTSTTNSVDLTGLTTGVTYTVSVTADCGTDGSSQAATMTFNTSLCDVTDQCAYTFNLIDSWGDGWNGGTLAVKQNGITVATLGLTSGASATEVVNLCHGVSTDLVWSAGNYPDEASFTVIGPDNAELYASSAMSTGTNTVYTFMPNCSACPMPTGLAASNITTTSATISWTGTADSYTVEYGVAGFTPGSGITSTTTSTTVDLTGLTAATAYTVYVTSTCGTDASSAAVLNFATTICDASNQCAYTFNLSDSYGDGWNGATMTVQQNGIDVATIGMTSGSSATETVNLCDGITTTLIWNSSNYDYEASFTVSDPSGNQVYATSGTPSGTLTTFTPNCSGAPVVCATPTNLTVASITDNGAVATWTAGGTETAWNLQYKTATSADWGTTIPCTQPTYTFSNLTAGTQYMFRVQADCGAGSVSAWSNATSFTTTGGQTVTDPTVATSAATGIAQTTATLNATITNPDNVAITAKGFQWKTTQGGTYTTVNGTGTGNSFTAALSNLTPNTQYTFKAFITFNGQTVEGSEVTFTTLNQDVEPCDVPTGLHTTDVQNESITIAWDANPNVTSWNIQYKPVGGTYTSATSTTNSYTITGLTGLTNYEIQVQAVCANGTSDWCTAITEQTTNVGIENWLSNSVTLYPNPAKEYVDIRVNDLNVSSMEVYDVYGKLINTVGVCDTPVQTRINVSNLANGMYFVRVTTEAGVVTKSFVKK